MRETTEQLLLASVVSNPHLFVDVSDAASPEMFTGHRKAWAKVIWSKLSDGNTVSYHTIYADTKPEHQKELESIFFSYGNGDGVDLANQLRESYLSSEASQIFQNAISGLLRGGNFSEVSNTVSLMIDELSKAGASGAKNIARYLEAADRLRNPNNNRERLPTGFANVDQVIGGWPIGMNILAARPGMGKTTLTLWLLIYAVLAGIPCLFYSYEMTTEDILTRIACYMCGYNANDRFRFTKEQLEEVAAKIEELKDLPLWIKDSQDFTGKVEDLKTEIQVMKQKHGIRLVAIDYLQLLSTYKKTDNEYRKTNVISGTIARVAQRAQLPIICLSQLSRKVEERGGDKRPKLADLRDSGKIEEDATSVTFVYRPEYYDIMEDENGMSLAGVTELIFAKFRPDGSVINKAAKFKFNPGTGEFQSEEKDSEFEYLPDVRIEPMKANKDLEDIPF